MKIIFTILLILLTISCEQKEKDVFVYENNILFLGIDDHNNSDLILFCQIKNKKVDFVLFPRDTLAHIPNHGTWIINLVHYRDGVESLPTWFKNNYNIQIDDYFAIKLSGIRGSVSNLSWLKVSAVKDYEYSEDWVRHRHKLGMEIYRGHRMLSYIDSLINVSSALPIPSSVEEKVIDTILEQSEKSSLNVTNLQNFRKALKLYPRDFRVWPGYYAKAKFNHEFFKGEKAVYITEKVQLSDVLKNTNGLIFEYSRTNFFKKNKPLPAVTVSNIIVGEYSNYIWL